MSTNVIERIKKLLKLAGNAGSEAEAALAADRARELMHQHNIAEAELRASEASEMRAAEEIIRGEVTNTTKKVAWHMRIAGIVDELYGCHAYWNGGAIRFFGRISAVQAATYTTQYLMAQVEEITDKQAPTSEYSRKYRNGFRLGCSERIRTRLRDQLEERKARERGDVTAETLTDDQIRELQVEAIQADVDSGSDDNETIRWHCAKALDSQYPHLQRAARAVVAEQINARKMATEIIANIFEDAAQPKASDGALMVLKKDQDEVDEGYKDFMYGKKNPKTGKRKRRGGGVNIGNVSSHDGYSAGKQAGNSINLGTSSRGALKRGTEVLK